MKAHKYICLTQQTDRLNCGVQIWKNAYKHMISMFKTQRKGFIYTSSQKLIYNTKNQHPHHHQKHYYQKQQNI